MAADVGYLVGALGGYRKDDLQRNEPPSLITRDLLGESFSQTDDSRELDLDLAVPAGWENRLDLKSGKNCSSRPATRPLQNTKGPTSKRPLNITPEDNILDLNLVASVKCPNNTYQSVCTLDKVKWALDREKHERLKRMFFPSRSFKSPSSFRLELDKDEPEENEKTTTSMSAAGCPNCLLYVMISNENPKCPKCNSTVSLPVIKRPRIDLNLNI